MTRRERGWTMFELMGSLAVIAAVSIAVGGLTSSADAARDLADGCGADVLESRRALAAIESDLRGATDAQPAPGVLAVVAPDGATSWALAGRSLVRRHAGTERVLAHNVASFAATRDGALVTVTLTFGHRSPNATRTASASTTVRLRAAGGPR